MQITNAIFDGNGAGLGGGLELIPGTARISRSTFRNNQGKQQPSFVNSARWI